MPLFFPILIQIANPRRISKYTDSLPSHKNALVKFDERECFHIFVPEFIKDFQISEFLPLSLVDYCQITQPTSNKLKLQIELELLNY